GAVRGPDLAAVGGIGGVEEDLAVEDREPERRGAGGAGRDGLDLDVPGGGAVGPPDLGPVAPVAPHEDEASPGRHHALLAARPHVVEADGAAGAGIDLGQPMGPGGGAAGPP